jgi:hypothetical protein
VQVIQECVQAVESHLVVSASRGKSSKSECKRVYVIREWVQEDASHPGMGASHLGVGASNAGAGACHL